MCAACTYIVVSPMAAHVQRLSRRTFLISTSCIQQQLLHFAKGLGQSRVEEHKYDGFEIWLHSAVPASVQRGHNVGVHVSPGRCEHYCCAALTKSTISAAE